MSDKDKKTEEHEEEEGQELCPRCGNLMIREGGELVCSSCSEDIDFFGDDEDDPSKDKK